MKKIYLSELTTEALNKRRNLLKGVVLAFGIIWLILIAIAVYFFVYRSNGKLFFPLTVFPMTILPLAIQVRALDKEFKRRQLNAQESNEL